MLKKCTQEKAVGFTIVVIVCVIVLGALIGMVLMPMVALGPMSGMNLMQ